MNPTPAWITESSSTQQRTGAVLMLLAGTALTWGFRQSALGPFLSGDQAGLWLGLMVLGGGITLLLFGGKTTITVDPHRRLISLVNTNWLREKRRVLRFDEVQSLSIGEVGDEEGGTPRYHVVVHLAGRQELALFHGFFEGSTSRPAMQARLERLQQILQQHPRAT